MTKGKLPRGRHLVITERAIIIIHIITNIVILINRSLWRRRWRESETAKARLSVGNATDLGINFESSNMCINTLERLDPQFTN